MRRIEVLMCTYRGERFVAEQLESILRQTRAVDAVSVYDDASGDHTVALVREVAARHAVPVHVAVRPRNLGYGANFWQAVQDSRGDLLLFSDQDDTWHPRKVELLEAAFDAAPDVGMAFSDGDLIDATGSRYTGRSVLDVHGVDAASRARFDADPLDELLRRNCVNGAAAAIAGPLARQAPPLPAGMPHDQWLAMWCCVAGWRLRLLPERLYGYRQHGSNAIGIGLSAWRHRVAGIWRHAWASRERDRWLYEQFAQLEAAAAVAVAPGGAERARAAQRRLAVKRHWLSAIVRRDQPRPLLAWRIAASLASGDYRSMASGDMLWRDLARLVRN